MKYWQDFVGFDLERPNSGQNRQQTAPQIAIELHGLIRLGFYTFENERKEIGLCEPAGL